MANNTHDYSDLRKNFKNKFKNIIKESATSGMKEGLYDALSEKIKLAHPDINIDLEDTKEAIKDAVVNSMMGIDLEIKAANIDVSDFIFLDDEGLSKKIDELYQKLGDETVVNQKALARKIMAAFSEAENRGLDINKILNLGFSNEEIRKDINSVAAFTQEQLKGLSNKVKQIATNETLKLQSYINSIVLSGEDFTKILNHKGTKNVIDFYKEIDKLSGSDLSTVEKNLKLDSTDIMGKISNGLVKPKDAIDSLLGLDINVKSFAEFAESGKKIINLYDTGKTKTKEYKQELMKLLAVQKEIWSNHGFSKNLPADMFSLDDIDKNEDLYDSRDIDQTKIFEAVVKSKKISEDDLYRLQDILSDLKDENEKKFKALSTGTDNYDKIYDKNKYEKVIVDLKEITTFIEDSVRGTKEWAEGIEKLIALFDESKKDFKGVGTFDSFNPENFKYLYDAYKEFDNFSKTLGVDVNDISTVIDKIKTMDLESVKALRDKFKSAETIGFITNDYFSQLDKIIEGIIKEADATEKLSKIQEKLNETKANEEKIDNKSSNIVSETKEETSVIEQKVEVQEELNEAKKEEQKIEDKSSEKISEIKDETSAIEQKTKAQEKYNESLKEETKIIEASSAAADDLTNKLKQAYIDNKNKNEVAKKNEVVKKEDTTPLISEPETKEELNTIEQKLKKIEKLQKRKQKLIEKRNSLDKSLTVGTSNFSEEELKDILNQYDISFAKAMDESNYKNPQELMNNILEKSNSKKKMSILDSSKKDIAILAKLDAYKTRMGDSFNGFGNVDYNEYSDFRDLIKYFDKNSNQSIIQTMNSLYSEREKIEEEIENIKSKDPLLHLINEIDKKNIKFDEGKDSLKNAYLAYLKNGGDLDISELTNNKRILNFFAKDDVIKNVLTAKKDFEKNRDATRSERNKSFINQMKLNHINPDGTSLMESTATATATAVEEEGKAAGKTAEQIGELNEAKRINALYNETMAETADVTSVALNEEGKAAKIVAESVAEVAENNGSIVVENNVAAAPIQTENKTDKEAMQKGAIEALKKKQQAKKEAEAKKEKFNNVKAYAEQRLLKEENISQKEYEKQIAELFERYQKNELTTKEYYDAKQKLYNKTKKFLREEKEQEEEISELVAINREFGSQMLRYGKKSGYSSDYSESSLNKSLIEAANESKGLDYSGQINEDFEDNFMVNSKIIAETTGDIIKEELSKEKFKELAEYGKEGYVEGFDGAGKSVAEDTIEEFEEATKTHSPSKVFEELGYWCGEGFKIGYDKSGKTIKKSVEEFISSIKDEMIRQNVSPAEMNNFVKNNPSKFNKNSNIYKAVTSLWDNLNPSIYGNFIDQSDNTPGMTSEERERILYLTKDWNKEYGNKLDVSKIEDSKGDIYYRIKGEHGSVKVDSAGNRHGSSYNNNDFNEYTAQIEAEKYEQDKLNKAIKAANEASKLADEYEALDYARIADYYEEVAEEIDEVSSLREELRNHYKALDEDSSYVYNQDEISQKEMRYFALGGDLEDLYNRRDELNKINETKKQQIETEISFRNEQEHLADEYHKKELDRINEEKEAIKTLNEQKKNNEEAKKRVDEQIKNQEKVNDIYAYGTYGEDYNKELIENAVDKNNPNYIRATALGAQNSDIWDFEELEKEAAEYRQEEAKAIQEQIEYEKEQIRLAKEYQDESYWLLKNGDRENDFGLIKSQENKAKKIEKVIDDDRKEQERKLKNLIAFAEQSSREADALEKQQIKDNDNYASRKYNSQFDDERLKLKEEIKYYQSLLKEDPSYSMFSDEILQKESRFLALGGNIEEIYEKELTSVKEFNEQLEKRELILKAEEEQQKKLAKEYHDNYKDVAYIQKNLTNPSSKLYFDLNSIIENEGNVYYKDYVNRAEELSKRIQSANFGDYSTDNLNNLRALKEETLSLIHAYNQPSNKQGSIDKLYDSIKNINNSLEKGVSYKFAKQYKSLAEEFKALGVSGKFTEEQLGELITKLKKLDSEAAEAGRNFFGQISQRLKDMNAKFIATYFSFQDIIRYVRTAVTTITELDTALTEMRKVTDDNLSTLKEYQKTTFDTANAIGTTAVQLQQSTADWLRLGESLDQASESAKQATILMNVSEFQSVDEATQSLVAMSQAYKDLSKGEIIDVLNNVGNNFSISTSELSTALQSSAATLMTQGNNLNEAVALITAGNSVVQDADKVGTGIRTISLRIAGTEEAKAQLADLDEDVEDYVVSTTAKKRQIIMDYTSVASNLGQGVDILDSNGNLKNTYQILLEISKVYKEIQEEDKLYGTNRAQGLVEELAGKNRSNIAASILLNPDLLENVYEDSLSSDGSAERELAKYMDSIIGKTQQFKNEFQELSSSIIDSKWIKEIIDLGTNILNIINLLIKNIPVLIPLIASLATGIISVKSGLSIISLDNIINLDPKKIRNMFKTFPKDIYNSISDNFSKYSELFDENIIIDTLFKTSKEDRSKIKDYLSVIFSTDSFQEGIENATELNSLRDLFDKSLGEAQEKLNDFDDDIKDSAKTLIENGVTSVQAYAEAEELVGLKAKIAAVGVELLNAAMFSIISIVATLVIGKAIEWFNDLANATENAKVAANEFLDEYNSVTKELRNNKKTIDELSDEYYELSKGVDDFGNNLSLSTENFNRYNDICNQIADLFPELVKGWTDTGNAILDTTNKVDGLGEAYQRVRKKQLQEMLTDGSSEEVLKNYQNLKKDNFIEEAWKTFLDTKSLSKYSYDEKKQYYDFLINSSYEEFMKAVFPKNAHGDAMYGGKISSFASDLGMNGLMTEEQFYSYKTQLSAARDIQEDEMKKATDNVRNLAEAYLELDEEYENLSDTEKNIANNVIKALDDSIISGFEDTTDVAAWVRQIVKLLNNDSAEFKPIKLTINDLFTLDTKNLSVKESKDLFDKYKKQLLDAVSNGQLEESDYELIMSGISDPEKYASMYDRLDTSIKKLADDNSNDLKMLAEYTKDFNMEQAEFWLNNINYNKSATAALEEYLNLLRHEKTKFEYSTVDKFANAFNSDTYTSTRNQLIGLAKEGKLDEETLASNRLFKQILTDIGITASQDSEEFKELLKYIQSVADKNSLNNLKAYGDDLKALSNSYESFKNNQRVTIEQLEELENSFGSLDSYKAFEEAVMSGEKKLQPYFDDMAAELLVRNTALDNITESTKQYYIAELKSIGIVNAEEVAETVLANKQKERSEILSELAEINTQKIVSDERAITTSEQLENATANEVAWMAVEADEAGITAESLAKYALKKILVDGTMFSEEHNINQIIRLAEIAGLGTERLIELQQAQANLDRLTAQRANAAGNTSAYLAYDKALKEEQKRVDKLNNDYQVELADILNTDYYTDVNTRVSPNIDTSGAEKEAKEALDKILALFQAELDAGVITFQEYVNKSLQAIEEYYKKGKITAQEYYDYLSDLYSNQIGIYDKVISAVQKVYSDEIDKLNKQKEEVQKSYNEQIEVIQKKIDSIQEENDEIDRNMALSKAQYQLARSQNQRTKLMYSESRGFYYEADLSSIKDAQEEVRKAQLDKEIYEYEKQIKSLQDTMEKEVDVIDKEIDRLQKLSDAWGEVSSKLENEINRQYAAQILGANWEKEVLEGRQKLLEDFTKTYEDLQTRQKNAYLDARRAEVNGVNNTGGSGGNSYNGDYKETGSYKTVYSYNGKDYETEYEANNAKNLDISLLQKRYKPMLDNVGKDYRANLEAEYNDKLEEIKKRNITSKNIPAKFAGTSHATPGETLVGELGSEIILNKNGTATIVDEPTIVDMKGGEKVFNAKETERILKASKKGFSSLKDINLKKFAMLNSFASGTSSAMQNAIATQAVGIASGVRNGLMSMPLATANGQTINNTFNVSLPNINDASKASDLMREFEHLFTKSTQYFN